MWRSGVWNRHQPHHGWYLLILCFLHHHHPRPRPCPRRCQPRVSTRRRAPPLYWGMWARSKPPRLPHKRGCSPSRPSPFQRDVGGLVSLDGESREGRRRKRPRQRRGLKRRRWRWANPADDTTMRRRSRGKKGEVRDETTTMRRRKRRDDTAMMRRTDTPPGV